MARKGKQNYDEKDFPEHVKLRERHSEYIDAISSFLDYLAYEKGMELCRLRGEEFHPVTVSARRLAFEYFGVDYDRFMKEKEKMIEILREAQQPDHEDHA